MHYDQKARLSAIGRARSWSWGGLSGALSPHARHYLWEAGAAGLPTPLAPAPGRALKSCGEPATRLWAEESCPLLLSDPNTINSPSTRLLDHMISAEID